MQRTEDVCVMIEDGLEAFAGINLLCTRSGRLIRSLLAPGFRISIKNVNRKWVRCISIQHIDGVVELQV